MAEERSIVEYFAEHERYRCGYCGNSDTNFSHGCYFCEITFSSDFLYHSDNKISPLSTFA